MHAVLVVHWRIALFRGMTTKGADAEGQLPIVLDVPWMIAHTLASEDRPSRALLLTSG